ncbi:MAG: ABC-type multidrug transport system, ATPase and permease component [Bacteroidota bacterium]|jgi:ATP-binding cassette subfamily B protein|nr:ABC-type multidrug transport system, ATPase and permease component [Bacteroidota bacterium]
MTEKKKSVIGKAVDIAILKRIFRYVRPYRTNFGMAVFTTISLAVLSIVRPLLVKYTFDHYVEIPNAEMLLNMTLLMLFILLLEAFFQFSDAFLTNTLGQKIIKDLRIQVFKHIIGFRLKYYDNTPIGMLVTRAVSDIEVIADIFSEGLIVIMGDILKVIVIVLIMFMINIQLTLIVLIPIPILLISTYVFKKAVANSFHEVRTQVARLNSFLQEHITGMRIVQIFNREKVEMAAFEEINGKHRDANIRSIKSYSIFFPVVEILSSVALALLVWWGGKGVLSKYTSLGDLMAFIMFLNMMFRPIRQLADRFNTLQMGMVSSERVFKVLDTDDKIANSGTKSAEGLQGNVVFKDVWFAYNNEDWILKNVSFEVRSGESIALVGATGAGKSSVINLLSRFYEYNKGSISIDGIDIREYELASLQKNIGVVLQDVFLFSDTILNNISLNNPAITREQIIDASKVIGAHEFISNLPGGYDYDVKERGAMLSVGQRQLISFIRAYVYNPKILVLDEATSSIDTESEKMIQFATEKITEGRTSVVIAHRLATIQKADKIIVLEKGEVIESGNHQELLRHNGHYKRLFELQFKEEKKQAEL